MIPKPSIPCILHLYSMRRLEMNLCIDSLHQTTVFIEALKMQKLQPSQKTKEAVAT